MPMQKIFEALSANKNIKASLILSMKFIPTIDARRYQQLWVTCEVSWRAWIPSHG